jgi:hypothetical protein
MQDINLLLVINPLHYPSFLQTGHFHKSLHKLGNFGHVWELHIVIAEVLILWWRIAVNQVQNVR